MNIAISSGKGGTGKTFIATNLAVILSESEQEITYLDCDVEEPNGHLFLNPTITKTKSFKVLLPVSVDGDKCTACGKCAQVCNYNAVAVVKDKVLFFPELCHACGACTIVCPQNAIIEKNKEVGVIHHGHAGKIKVHYGVVNIGEAAMSPRMISEVKMYAGGDITFLDSSPGTACPVVETVKDADYCVLVTDPTLFGIHDLKLAVNMCRKLGQEPGVVVNRATLDTTTLYEYLSQEGLVVVGEIPDDRSIAEVYSGGGMVVDEIPEYRSVFEELAVNIQKEVQVERPAKIKNEVDTKISVKYEKPESTDKPVPKTARELIIVSGKGGTGKTSLAGCFAVLAEDCAISDCDVDASDLPILLKPEVRESGDFSGGLRCTIDLDECLKCGRCQAECRFNAIEIRDGKYTIDEIACEGCGVCQLVCPGDAVECRDAINGKWFVSDTRCGPMTHAELGIAEENSGKLVTLVRNNASNIATEQGRDVVLIDGSPGTGCPVVASLTGADFALIITEPTVSGLHDMERILSLTAYFRIPSGVIVNKYDINPAKTEEIRKKTISMGAEYLGEVPYDTLMTQAQVDDSDQRTLVEYAPDAETADAIRGLWAKIEARLK
ncbi:P-loop NTPase [Planctomycetota bacterium]